MKIAVYLGANYGSDKNIEKETEKLGEWIGRHHHTLVFGGSKTGLMGTLAQATKKNGGRIIGVELTKFHKGGASFDGCDDFLVYDTLLERKAKMMEISNAFIALPGGFGTLDEISEIMALDKINEEHRVIVLMNIDGFYDDLSHQLDKMVSFGFLKMEERSCIHFADSVEELAKILK
jgi:uncharacterized protein (TIGR00730 family)